MVQERGIEPLTSSSEDWRSIQLSYSCLLRQRSEILDTGQPFRHNFLTSYAPLAQPGRAGGS